NATRSRADDGGRSQRPARLHQPWPALRHRLHARAHGSRAGRELPAIDDNAEHRRLSSGRDDRRGNQVKITDIRSTVVAGNFDWILVRVYTDEGLVGLGEAYWGPGVRAILADPRFKSI